jgi:predicted exporter
VTLRTRSWLFLAAIGVAAALLAGLLSRGVPLQTNVLAMLPATERDPVAEKVVAALSDAIGRRVLFLFSHAEESRAKAAAERFAAEARSAGGLRGVTARLPEPDPKLLHNLYAVNRFGLLAESDREALASGRWRLRDTLLQQLVSPVGGFAGLPLSQDPFGFFGRWVASIAPSAGTMRFEDGYLISREAGRTRVLVFGEVDGDVYDNAVQTRAVAAYERGARAALAAEPGSEILRTGTVFFAASARAAAMSDMDRIAVGSIVGIALVMLAAFRSLRPIALGLLSAGAGILAATLALVLVDGELHLVTLAFGASLIGEAIDYAILFCAAHLAAGSRWTPEAGVKQVRPALTVAVATSLLAYALLGLLPFPGISQVARFALVGLVVAYLSVQWLLPGLLQRPSRRDPLVVTGWAARLLERWSGFLSGKRAVAVAALVLFACIPGWLALQPNDDVRLLVPRQPELALQDAAIRAMTGFDAGTRFFLVRGASDDEVLEREAALTRRLRELESAGALTGHQAVSDFVPPRAAQEANRALVRKHVFADRDALARTLIDVGFRPEAAKALPGEFDRAAKPVTVADWLASPLSTPFRHLWAPAGDAVPASVVTLVGEREPARVAQAHAALDGVILVDKATSVSLLLGKYRAWAGPGLAAAALMMLIVLALRYGARPALAVLVPVLLGEALSLAAFGYAGVPVTLFGVVGWTLGLGIGVNYSIFLREGIERPGATAMAVLLSACTTLLGFGLLAFSGVPALRHFGLALAATIAGSLLFAPLALSGRKT